MRQQRSPDSLNSCEIATLSRMVKINGSGVFSTHSHFADSLHVSRRIRVLVLL